MRIRVIASTVLIGMAASACSVGSGGSSGGVNEVLGISATSPDEFLIIARKPLELPASFDLPRPQPGAPSRVELDPFADAHAALYRRPDPVRLASSTQGEQVLLSGANADGDNSIIRTVIAGTDPAGEDREFGLTSLFGIPIPAQLSDDDDILDSSGETEQLRQRGYLTPAAPPIVDEEDPDFGGNAPGRSG